MARTPSWRPSHDGFPRIRANIWDGDRHVGFYTFNLDALYEAWAAQSSRALAKVRIRRLRAAHEHGALHLVYLLHIVATSLGTKLPTNKRQAETFLAQFLPTRPKMDWRQAKSNFQKLRASMKPWFTKASRARNFEAVRAELHGRAPDLYRLLAHLDCLPGSVSLEDAALRAGHAFCSKLCTLQTYQRRVRSKMYVN